MGDNLELCKLAQKGDKEAFGELYGLYAKELYRYAYFVLGSAELAADAVQDAVLSAFEQIKSLRKPESFKAWLFKILANTCKKHLGEKIRQRNTLVYDENISPHFFKENTAQDDFLDLKRAFEILSPDQRQIVVLCVAEGYKSREVAEILGVRPGTVRSKLSRALQKMREELTAY